MQPKLVVITGPTASGKTALGVMLAQRLGGEVVSADSMQIYRGMDIGTAKPTPEEMQGVPHHMIDIAISSRAENCRSSSAGRGFTSTRSSPGAPLPTARPTPRCGRS